LMIDRIKWKLQNLYLKAAAFYHLRNKGPESTIIICGSGRSGTTWLAEQLSYLEGSFTVFEPLKRGNSKRLMTMDFDGGAQHIPQGTTRKESGEIVKLFDELMIGGFMNPNHSNGRIKGFLNYQYLILKFIRLHLSLPWIVDNYLVKKPIYLIRNPYAVISSQWQHDAFPNILNTLEIPQTPFNSLYKRFEHVFPLIDNNIKRKTFYWALEQWYILNHPFHHKKKWLMVCYEDLITDPEQQLANILKGLGIQDDSALDNMLKNIQRPSNSFNPKSSLEDQLHKWKKKLNENQVKDIDQILSFFDLDNAYDKDSGLINPKFLQ